MPGNIIRVCVKNGEKVNRGQTLMVLEAMKMEHPILAPENGRVESLLFKEGDIVKTCLLYTSPSPRDRQKSRMPSSA